jgi:hypothetical protein
VVPQTPDRLHTCETEFCGLDIGKETFCEGLLAHAREVLARRLELTEHLVGKSDLVEGDETPNAAYQPRVSRVGCSALFATIVMRRRVSR